MANLVLAASNHVTFTSSIWASLASAPRDLLLVAEDGVIEAHSKILLPLSRHLAAVVEAQPNPGPTLVVLAGRSIKAVTAVRDLIYTGLCHLDELILPEILETLSVLGIQVSSNSFSFKSEDAEAVGGLSTHPHPEPDASSDVLLESVKEKLSDMGDEVDIKEKTEDPMKAFEGITVESIWSKRCEEKSEVTQMSVPVMNTREEHCVKKGALSCVYPSCKMVFGGKDSLMLHMENMHSSNKPPLDECRGSKSNSSLKAHIQTKRNNKKIFTCDVIDCKMAFGRKFHLKRHKSVHNKERPHQCSKCSTRFSEHSNLRRHIEVVHNNEKPHACPQPDCAQKYGQKFELKDHLRSAHGAAKLVCGFENCASTFTHQCKLSVHKKEHHSDK